MKILSICHDHPDFTPGGTELFARALSEALGADAAGGCDFLAVSTSLTRPQTPSCALERFGGDYLLRTGAYDRFAMERLDGGDWVRNLVGLVRDTAYDVVLLHGLDRLGASAVTALRQRFPALKICLVLHDYQLICPNEGLLLRRYDNALCTRPTPDACGRCFPETPLVRHTLRAAHLKAVLSQIDAFIAPSRFTLETFVAWGLPRDRMHLIRNAPPADHGASSGGIAGAAARPSRFAFLGNLGAHKGIEVLLDAASRLARDDLPVSLNIHGDMPFATAEERAVFNDRCAAAAPVAQYLGPYTQAELPALMAAADWIVLPSLWYENAPLVLLEAQRAGKPVICTPLGGLPELVSHGVNGLHVPRGDGRALAETMASVAADRALWARLAANVAAPCAFAEVAARYRRLFDALLSEVPA